MLGRRLVDDNLIVLDFYRLQSHSIIGQRAVAENELFISVVAIQFSRIGNAVNRFYLAVANRVNLRHSALYARASIEDVNVVGELKVFSFKYLHRRSSSIVGFADHVLERMAVAS